MVVKANGKMKREDLSGRFYYERAEWIAVEVQRATYRGIGGDAVAGRAGCVGLAGRGCLSLGVLGAGGGLGDGGWGWGLALLLLALPRRQRTCGAILHWQGSSEV